ncbi:MAG: AarF/ABC1/UbiB kinase family protein, partial [Anaerolineales bacterium]|nr:AarF/ABC1/UbiB kinase family protein [Anaerolineales bacterium]
GDWRLVFVDFGMVGHLTPEMKDGLRDLAIAVGTRNLDRLMQAFKTMGVILPGADLDRIRQAEAALFDQMWGKSMRDLTRTHPQEMRKFASEFRDVLYEMPFQVPSDMIYLGRCVAILSGMCTGLDPDFNLFEGLRPFAEQLLAEDGADWLGELLKVLGEQIRVLATLPKRLDATLTVIERGDLIVTAKASPELQKQLSRLTSAVYRLVGVGIFAAFLVVGSILYINEQFVLGIIFFSLAFVSLTWALLKPLK